MMMMMMKCHTCKTVLSLSLSCTDNLYSSPGGQPLQRA
jgi:hypothetical protein